MRKFLCLLIIMIIMAQAFTAGNIDNGVMIVFGVAMVFVITAIIAVKFGKPINKPIKPVVSKEDVEKYLIKEVTEKKFDSILNNFKS